MKTALELNAIFHNMFTNDECSQKYIMDISEGIPSEDELKEFIQSTITRDAKKDEYVYVLDNAGNDIAIITIPNRTIKMTLSDIRESFDDFCNYLDSISIQ